MSKGHRRTQSSNLACTASDDFVSVLRKETPIAGHEIEAFLAISSDKIRDKVSTVDTLDPPTPPDDPLFLFGRVSGFREVNINKRNLREEYMAPIVEKKESPDWRNTAENRDSGVNPFSKKARKGVETLQLEPRFSRQPFTNTLNFCSPTNVKKILNWRFD
jgi:hypothetical protein